MALIKFPTKSLNTDAVNPFVNTVFDNLFNDNFISDRLVSRVPAVNISETEKSFKIEMAAPGLDKSDFKINVDKNLITISAEKKEESVSEEKLYSKKEFNYSSFSRSFTLPETVDYSNIEAAYEGGILILTVGKKEDAIIAKRLIEVK
ncbi:MULTISPECIES: Hsp20/alpha crystallin family protein [Sphingobacterium]|jgi:HSP20 family protein|uniref:Spore protein SP21 n=1 Tax=Sphingobacterium multivorum TaxID=28454 RepID=A0A2X2JI35_SPHMU|nr:MULTISPECIES: Hsp20/alpha crystallin family protein [Sphingobacterium]HAE66881.1 Hsp20/alpha crystallin family protein [Sphingobacterium sp.]MDF2852182.1 heat-shock protein [Sphingobacterium multivorum]OJZ06677.1 MAG: heat-shock protein [Sphingobacterium sp. 40-24]QQT47424.1 Hsp20/alpha crystallin family protein [Sphingobacterium multivorum]QRQ60265.1 Hsp20/alpha crystallin family protein [Sphingobacterium multivorum]